jgi:hypothetical protein
MAPEMKAWLLRMLNSCMPAMGSPPWRELGDGMCFNNEILLAAAVLQGTHAADRLSDKPAARERAIQ